MLSGKVAILCGYSMHITNHVPESSVDWSLYINVKKKSSEVNSDPLRI